MQNDMLTKAGYEVFACDNGDDAIAKAKQINGDDAGAKLFRQKAQKRSILIDKYFWNKSMSFFTDYQFKTQTQFSLNRPSPSTRTSISRHWKLNSSA